MTAVVIHRRTADDPQYRRLIAELDRLLSELNGDLDGFYAPLNLSDKLAGVVVAEANGEFVGCGAFRPMPDGAAEIKRMYVQPSARGSGIGVAILQELETWASESGHPSARLETSERLASAVGLYRRAGYRQIPNYPSYEGAGDSVCFEKELQ